MFHIGTTESAPRSCVLALVKSSRTFTPGDRARRVERELEREEMKQALHAPRRMIV